MARKRIYLDDVIHDGLWVRNLMQPDSAFSDHFVKQAAVGLFSLANRYLRQLDNRF